MDVTPLPMLTLLNPEQNSNVFDSIELTELGIVRFPARLLQLAKAEFPIEVTEFPMVRLMRPEQPLNALLPIEVTEFPMVRFPLKPVQP